MRYHLTSVRLAVIKKTTNNKGWCECREKETLGNSWWECKLVQTLWKIVWGFLKKLKMGLLYESTILLLGIYLVKTKTLIQKDTCTRCVH